MAAYVIADITVLNPELYEDYRRQVPALQRYYRSDDYQVLLRIRQNAARSNIVAVEGV